MEFHGWELRKALRMLRDSNPGLLEWLRSPIIYHSDSFFYERALQLVQQFHSHKSMAHHYTNIAKKHYNLYFKVNYFAILFNFSFNRKDKLFL